LHALQRNHVVGRHEIGAGGQRLSNLDEGGTKRLEVADELFRGVDVVPGRRFAVSDRAGTVAVGAPAGVAFAARCLLRVAAPQRVVEGVGVEHAGIAVLDEQQRDLVEGLSLAPGLPTGWAYG